MTGSTLKRRQHYKPKGTASAKQDIKAQNAWLLSNVFDASGNYLYFLGCIVSVLGVGGKHLARLRKVKQGELSGEHKLKGKQSKRSKSDVKAKFLEFVDLSRSANGRRVGSSSAEYYFDAINSSFRAPDKQDKEYEKKVRRSVVGCFNKAQEESGLPTVGNIAAREWLNKEKPKK